MNKEMMKAMAGKQMPEMAIVESNTLAAMGLRQLLESVMPMMKISTFGSFRQYEANNPDHFVHSLYLCTLYWNTVTSSHRATGTTT